MQNCSKSRIAINRSILRNQTITLPLIGGGPVHGNETPYKTEFEIS
jgi:hypothetical protein